MIVLEHNSTTSAMIIVVGEGGVGKSTLIKYLLHRAYMPQKLTVGLNVEVCRLMVNGVEHSLTIKDAGGEERFQFMLPMWVRGAHGALLVFDLGRYHTFMHLPQWLELLAPSLDKRCILLVGAKADIGIAREVDEKEAENFAKAHGLAAYVETSAKTGLCVVETFEMLVRQMLSLAVSDKTMTMQTEPSSKSMTE